MLPPRSSFTYRNKYGLGRFFPLHSNISWYAYWYVHKVHSNYYYFFLCVRQSAKNGTYLAAVIDGYYFPAHGVCLKRAADVPALDSVHLKFSVWVRFLRQTNAAWLPASSSRPRLSAYLAQKIVSSPLCPSPSRVYLGVTWESVCLPGEGVNLTRREKHLDFLFYFYFF